MGPPITLAWTSLALSLLVATIAALLGLRLWWERRTRDDGLPDADRRHFLYQDLRRGLGILLMASLAAGVYVGSRMPTFAVEPRDPRLRESADAAAGAIVQAALVTHPNRQFVAVWLGIFGSTVLLLGLAMIDWIATRRYAHRHRQAIQHERLEILRDTLRHADTNGDGLADGRSW